jgi:hypothetical protein
MFSSRKCTILSTKISAQIFVSATADIDVSLERPSLTTFINTFPVLDTICVCVCVCVCVWLFPAFRSVELSVLDTSYPKAPICQIL